MSETDRPQRAKSSRSHKVSMIKQYFANDEGRTPNETDDDFERCPEVKRLGGIEYQCDRLRIQHRSVARETFHAVEIETDDGTTAGLVWNTRDGD